MQELEFRQALRDEMSLVTRPQRLKETEVLDAAKAASRRRRGAWATAGSVVAVAALAVGTVFTATGDRSGPGTAATSTPQPPDEGMSGSLATSGPHYELGVTLLDLMLEAVPPGFDTPTDLTAPAGNNLRGHSASVRGGAGGEWWEYVAVVPISKEGRFGRLVAFVRTPGNNAPEVQGCELAVMETGYTDCQEMLVDGLRVGLIHPRPHEVGAQNQIAVYRHQDGTVVHIEQCYDVSPISDLPPLAELPLTPQQFAELAAEPRLRLI